MRIAGCIQSPPRSAPSQILLMAAFRKTLHGFLRGTCPRYGSLCRELRYRCEVTGGDIAVPAGFDDLVDVIPVEAFRNDLSSTQINREWRGESEPAGSHQRPGAARPYGLPCFDRRQPWMAPVRHPSSRSVLRRVSLYATIRASSRQPTCYLPFRRTGGPKKGPRPAVGFRAL